MKRTGKILPWTQPAHSGFDISGVERGISAPGRSGLRPSRAWLAGLRGGISRALLLAVVGVSIGLTDPAMAAADGIDSFLRKGIEEMFPTASNCKSLSEASRFSRAPQVVEVRNGELLIGYGVALHVVSRSGPFRILVAVSPEETVMEVKIPKYPHRRGRGVRKGSFLEQFKGVSYGEPFKLGEQVDGVSGATSSATAVTDGVRQALMLVRRHRPAVETDGKE